MEHKIDLIITQYPEEGFEKKDNNLYCSFCQQNVSFSRMFLVKQHLKTVKHYNTKQLLFVPNESAISEEDSHINANFCKELCEALIASNIPFWKLENEKLRNFLKKYIRFTIPHESTIRKNNLKLCYEDAITNIWKVVSNKKIWISIDETTDRLGRYIVNTIVGVLGHTEEENKMFLLDSQVVKKLNSQEMVRAVDNSLKILGDDFSRDNLMLLVTDAAAYMGRAGNILTVLYPNLIHVTCVAHALHRVAEFIRSRFPDVDLLISNIKKCFCKCPSRVAVFKEYASEIPLPPNPVITRWGTWINASSYCAKNLNVLKTVFDNIHDDSSYVQICKNLLSDPSVSRDLYFIDANYGFLPSTIEKLETQGLSIVQSLSILDNAEEKITNVPGIHGEEIHLKMSRILEKNSGLSFIKRLRNVFVDSELESEIEFCSPDNIMYFLYAPITSCDVERSFSSFEYVLSDRRMSFTENNLKHYVVSHCYSC